jgi:putative redox protein
VKNFGAHLDQIRERGEATVTLAGRPFTIKSQFLDDLAAASFHDRIARMRKALLVFHAPTDNVVGIENAAMIFAAAKHPKSFIALNDADHLLSRREDAAYVAAVLASWVSRHIKPAEDVSSHAVPEGAVHVSGTGNGKFQQLARAGEHMLLVDEPEDVGGTDTGPSPYDFLAIALGACTSMTLRLYAEHKGIAIDKVEVLVEYSKRHLEDCKQCGQGADARLDHFDRVLKFSEDLPDETKQKLIAIADRCPVHRTLEKGAHIVTRAEPALDPDTGAGQ